MEKNETLLINVAFVLALVVIAGALVALGISVKRSHAELDNVEQFGDGVAHILSGARYCCVYEDENGCAGYALMQINATHPAADILYSRCV